MAYSDERRAKVRDFLRATKDRVLEPNEPELVSLSDQAATDVVEDIATEVDLGDGQGVCLLTGQSGTGKSTALRRLKHRLEEFGATALYIDLSLAIATDRPVEISDFLIAVAGAMSEAVQVEVGASPGGVGYWDRVVSFLRTKVQFRELSATYAGITLKADLRDNVGFRQRMQAAARPHVPALVACLRKFVVECVECVRTQRHDRTAKVVLLVDSVERIRGSRAVYESIRDLFLQNAAYLIIPELHVVYTVPPYLTMLAPGAAGSLGATLIRRLSSVKVWTKGPNRVLEPSGVASMRALLQARYQGWSEVFEPSAVDALALSSGGDLRQFLRLVKASLVAAVREDIAWPISPAALRHVQLAMGSDMAQLPREQLDWLQRIKDSNRHCLDREEDLSTLAHFLDNQLVLTYRNGHDWYDVHPMVRDSI